MAYKRKDLLRPEKVHNLQENWGSLGQINTSNDPGWIYPHLVELMDDGVFALSQFQSAIKSASELDMSEYKKEVAAAKRAELILKGKRAMLSFLKKHISKYKSECNAVENAILRITQPDSPSDPTKAMLQEMRFKEIRDNLRQINPKDRRAAIAGNLSRIQACLTNPDPSDIIIAESALTEIRREFAFKSDPSLVNLETDQKEIYRAVRKRAGDISATANLMMIHQKIDDPTSPAEHFEVFEPEDEYAKEIAARRIKAWDERQGAIERDKKFKEEHEGVNLQTGERAARIARGIQH